VDFLGIGALGFPLLGLGIGLAGFDRLPRLDMKRVAVLVVGLSVVVPFLVGIVTHVTRATSMDPRFRLDSPDSARG
jgi:hypothetical protein